MRLSFHCRFAVRHCRRGIGERAEHAAEPNVFPIRRIPIPSINRDELPRSRSECMRLLIADMPAHVMVMGIDTPITRNIGRCRMWRCSAPLVFDHASYLSHWWGLSTPQHIPIHLPLVDICRLCLPFSPFALPQLPLVAAGTGVSFREIDNGGDIPMQCFTSLAGQAVACP